MKISRIMSGRIYGGYEKGAYQVNIRKLRDGVFIEFSKDKRNPAFAQIELENDIAEALGTALIVAAKSDVGFEDIISSNSRGQTSIKNKKGIDWLEVLVESLSNILLGLSIPYDIVDRISGKIIIPANKKITKARLRLMAGFYKSLLIEPSPIQIKIDEIIEEVTGFRPTAKKKR